MELISVKQAAEKWGVSTRRVQDLCKRGQIPGATLWERTWMLPAEAVYPGKEPTKMPMPRKSPFLTMTDLYTQPGSADAVVASLASNPEAQALFQAEIDYCRGDIDAVYEKAQYFLSSRSGPFAVIAGGMLLGLCAMWRGDLQMYQQAKLHVCHLPGQTEADHSLMELSLAVMGLSIRDLRGFPEWFKKGQFSRLPVQALPAARVYYIECLVVYAQELAMQKYTQEGIEGLALLKVIPNTAEPFITQAVVEKTVMAELYLRLQCAVCCHHGGDEQRAIHHIDKAIALALADGLLGPLAEYRRQLGNLLDDRLALVDGDALKKLKLFHKQFDEGWTKLHNAVLERRVSLALSPREREVARLAAFGCTDAQIAEQLHLSKATVKSLISMAKNKTGAEKRSELVAYI